MAADTKLNEEMYQEEILDNYRNPKNFGSIENAEIVFRDSNPSCGDAVEISIRVKGKIIKDIKFNGKGCAISAASASMITDFIKGKNLNDVVRLSKEDVYSMLGIKLSAMRIKCALLPLKVLKYGVYNFLGKRIEEEYDN